MSKRFGKMREPNCECTHIFTCRACCQAAAWRARSGKPLPAPRTLANGGKVNEVPGE